MSQTRSVNMANSSKIIGIQFSILSPEEIRKSSVAEITSRDTYLNNTSFLTPALFTSRIPQRGF
jgi:DNA-directed RNA polymerase beta' subunit